MAERQGGQSWLDLIVQPMLRRSDFKLERAFWRALNFEAIDASNLHFLSEQSRVPCPPFFCVCWFLAHSGNGSK